MSDEVVFDGRKPGSIGAGLHVIWQESRRGMAVRLVIAVVFGLVPATSSVLAGRAVAQVLGGSAPTGTLVTIAAIYGAAQIAETFLFPLDEGWSVMLYGRVNQRAMRAASDPPLIDYQLDAEGQRLIDLAGRQEWPHIGAFANAAMQATTWLVGALGQAVLVARFNVLLAVVTTAAWLAVGTRIRRQELAAMLGAWDSTRRAHYFRRFALEHKSAAEIRAFGLGHWLIERFDEGWTEGMAEAWRKRVATGRKIIPLLVLLVVTNIVGIALIASAAERGDLDPSRLATTAIAFAFLAQLALPQQWTESLLWGATRLPALLELEAVALAETARSTPANPKSCDGLPARAIRFEGVTFGYPGRSEPVLRDLDLTIEAGRSLAIVGVNGAGKTTLAKLIARLHDPTTGRITVDGIDLRSMHPVEWQHRVAAVFQEYIRYPLSAADNVALGPLASPPDPATLGALADFAGAHDVIADLPRGWDTVLSRRYGDGAELSGGQWQRLALARAIHAVRAGAGVLVLDEPTANLDARGEAELFERFLEIAEGTTTVLISHRFSTVKRADRIVVLDQGHLIETGTHDELVALGGLYERLYRLQADRYELEEGSR